MLEQNIFLLFLFHIFLGFCLFLHVFECNPYIWLDHFFPPFFWYLLGLTAWVLPAMTRFCLHLRPRPPWSIQAKRDELLSAAHHPVFFMFAFFLDKKKESAHTPKSFTRLKAPLHMFFFLLPLCTCARVSDFHTSTPNPPPTPVLSARRATSKSQ